MAMSVNPSGLSAGVNQVAKLFGDCEKATAGVVETLGGMTSAAGHPGLTSALTAFTESGAKALLNTGQALTYIAAGLKTSAAEYSKTESANTANINAAGPRGAR
jgi:hypothetical protein